MRKGVWAATVSILMLTGGSAWADQKAQCLAGIKAIEAAIAKIQPNRFSIG